MKKYNNEEDILLNLESKDPLPIYIVWLIWAIWPMYIIIQSRSTGARSLDFISFIGPIIMLIMPLTYKLMVKAGTQRISEDEKINLLFNKKIQRNNSIHYAPLFLFIQLIMIAMEQVNLSGNPFWLIMIIIGLGIGSVVIAAHSYLRQARIEKEFAPYKTIKTEVDRSKYHMGFYYNREDKRIFVPKINPTTGWTINFANPKGKLIGGAFLSLAAVLILGVIYISYKDISYEFKEEAFEITAPLFNRKIDYKDIVEVKLSDEKISASRANGYGGLKMAYGHFKVKDYGNTMYYYYFNVKNRVFIKLKNMPEQWYILNDKTEEDTRILYDKLKAKE